MKVAVDLIPRSLSGAMRHNGVTSRVSAVTRKLVIEGNIYVRGKHPAHPLEFVSLSVLNIFCFSKLETFFSKISVSLKKKFQIFLKKEKKKKVVKITFFKYSFTNT